MKRLIPSLIFTFFLATGLGAQQILVAPGFFDQVAAKYATVADYIADVEIISSGTTMTGILYFRAPNLIRIDFNRPAEQVLVSDGRTLQIFVPGSSVTLVQTLDGASGASNPGGLASAEGLSLLKRNYSIAYKTGPDPESLDAASAAGGSNEPVVKLLLRWRNTSEGFREIELAINSDQLIRRISGITADNRNVQITFSNIRINQNIPVSRFEYSSPSTSNNFNNFLFGTEN